MDLDAGANGPPLFYCVPADIVYVFAWAGWAAKSRRERGATNLRFSDFGAYRDRFDLLDRDATTVGWDLTGAIWDWIQHVGAPAHVPLSRQPIEG